MEIHATALRSVQLGGPAVSGRAASQRELRYVMTLALHDEGRTMTVQDLVDVLDRRGIQIPGRASKTVSDALRWEVARGRVVRAGRGRYRTGAIPRSTKWWLERQVDAMRTDTILAPGGYSALR